MGMKSSTIKSLIRKRLSDWSASLASPELQAMVKRDTIVSGGCIASMLLGEKINDYDLYFRTKETALALANYYTSLFNSLKGNLTTTAIASCNPEVKVEPRTNIKGETEERIIIYMKSSGVAGEDQDTYSYFEQMPEGVGEDFIESVICNDDIDPDEIDPVDFAETSKADLKLIKFPYRPIFLSENAITLSDKVQLVVRFFGEPDKIHENYDFAHAMCYYDWQKDYLHLPADALECMLTKTLIYKGSLYPVASVFRTRKFIQRGWRITAGQQLKMIFQLQKVDLHDVNVLREQLIGVDQAYMHQLLRALDNETGRVDSTYLANLVDKIFD